MRRKSSHGPHHSTAPGESETHVSLNKAPFSTETRAWTCLFLSASPPNHAVFRLFPPANRRCGTGRAAVFNPVGRGHSLGVWRGGAWREGKGWSGLRPLVLIEVRRCKSIKKHLLPTDSFLSGAGPVLCPGASRAPGSFLGNSRHADLHCEAGPGASCCSPGTG